VSSIGQQKLQQQNIPPISDNTQSNNSRAHQTKVESISAYSNLTKTIVKTCQRGQMVAKWWADARADGGQAVDESDS